jgi:hypothetical protein
MTKHHTKAKATAIALIAAAGMFPVFVSSVPALAQPSGSSIGFQRNQQALEGQIIARQVQLALLGTNIADAASVTTSDRTALSTIITNEQTALATDATNAAAATTNAELDSVRQAVIGDERVYVVVSAQVRLVINADTDAVTEAGYTNLVTELTPLVNELGSSLAAKRLADVTSEVSAATALTNGVSAGALALTPAGYPGNESQVKTWDYQLNQVARDLELAKLDVKAIEAIALHTRLLPPPLVSPAPTTTTTTVPPTTTTTV